MSPLETFLLITIFSVLVLILLGGSLVLNAALRHRQGDTLSNTDTTLDVRIKSSRFFLYSTVGGTLTSLASVYVFFLLQYPFFGAAMFVTLLAFPLGGWIGQRLALQALRAFNATDDGRAAIGMGLISAIVRVNSDAFTARLFQILSIVNISAVVWLEIKILTTIVASVIFGLNYEPSHSLEFSLIAGLVAVLLVQFVFRFGMQGVVVTDALYWPFIILSVVIIALVALTLAFDETGGFTELAATVSFKPLIDPLTLSFFLLNILLVNAVYHVGRDDLWLRLSAFGGQSQHENLGASSLFKATLFALPVWLVLILVGMLIPILIGQPAGSIVDVVNAVRVSSIILPVLILGMVAAMLSTCDNQFFALKRLFLYSPYTNNLRPWTFNGLRTAIVALTVGLLVFLVTWAAIFFRVDDQNLVFACLGLPAIVFPGVKRSLDMRKTSTTDVMVPAVVYVGLIILGLNQGGMPSLFIIAAAPVSLLVGLIYSGVRA